MPARLASLGGELGTPQYSRPISHLPVFTKTAAATRQESLTVNNSIPDQDRQLPKQADLLSIYQKSYSQLIEHFRILLDLS